MGLLNIDCLFQGCLNIASTAESDAHGVPTLCVFGYGSLIWNPGFAYQQQHRAVVHGYSRRFYQGNCTFRGTPEQVPESFLTAVLVRLDPVSSQSRMLQFIYILANLLHPLARSSGDADSRTPKPDMWTCVQSARLAKRLQRPAAPVRARSRERIHVQSGPVAVFG